MPLYLLTKEINYLKELQAFFCIITDNLKRKYLMTDYNIVYETTKDLNVLFVEDDKNLREETTDVLNNLFKSLDTSVDGKEGLIQYNKFFNEHKKFYDIVVADINMPHLNGIELTKEIYKLNSEQPIVIVSAHNEPRYLLELINIGIKQFLTKPLEYDNILEVFHTIANDIVPIEEEESSIVSLGENLIWDKDQNLLIENDVEIELTNRELLLMKLFIKNNNRVSTYEEIFSLLWEEEFTISSPQLLKPVISRLKKKVPSLIINSISKLGYRLQ